MKNVKMKSVSLAASLVTISLLTACGGNESGSDSEVTVEFMHSSVEEERRAVIDDLVKQFEEDNPNINVEQVPVEEDNYNTKIVTLANSGELPEVIEVGQDYAKVMDKDQLIDREAVNTSINNIGEDNYYDGALNLMSTEDGESYMGAPISGWVQGIWYNKEMLEEEGFEEPKNWDEILEIAKTFSENGDDQYGIGLPTAESTFSEQVFSQFALSNNANVLDAEGNLNINTPKMVEALDYYKELSQYTLPGSNDTTEVNDAFMNGTVPMTLYSTYLLPSVYEAEETDNIGYAVPENKSSATYASVSSLTISSGLEENKKEASQKFIEYLSTPENMTDWVLMSPGGAQPVSEQVTQNEKYQENEVVNSFGDLSTEIASSFDNTQIFGLVDGNNYVKMGDITSSGAISRMVNEVTVNNGDPEKAVEEAEKELEEVVE